MKSSNVPNANPMLMLDLATRLKILPLPMSSTKPKWSKKDKIPNLPRKNLSHL